jgi:monofunctional biosynthetic peptidoglycan transglycosylase
VESVVPIHGGSPGGTPARGPDLVAQPAGDDRWADSLRLLAKAARYAGYFAAGYLALVLVLILAYRVVDPPGSTLILWRWLGGTAIDRTWVPIEQISPNLVRAVVVAEDGRFCDHWGIDFEAIEEAIARAGDGVPRGASTISMQVVKNLFLWSSKSYLRKLIELPLTVVMELVWPKRRILEIYLNIAEWGPGVFGAEAAARHHFHKSASRLGESEAALLAASLPNPVRRDASDPGPRTSHKARVIQARMRIAGPVAGCVAGGGAGADRQSAGEAEQTGWREPLNMRIRPRSWQPLATGRTGAKRAVPEPPIPRALETPGIPE